MTQFSSPDPDSSRPQGSTDLNDIESKLPAAVALSANALSANALSTNALSTKLSQLVGFPKEFLEDVLSVVLIDERSIAGVISPQLSLAGSIHELLKAEREQLEVNGHAANERVVLFAFAAAQILNPLLAMEAENTEPLRLVMTEEILACAALVVKNEPSQQELVSQYIDALAILSLGGHLQEWHFQKLRDLDRSAVVQIVGETITKIRDDGFPHALPSADLTEISSHLLGLVSITKKLRVYELFDELDGILRDVHGWNTTHSDRYGLMGGMAFAGSSDTESFAINEYVPENEVDLGDFYAESFSCWTSYQSDGKEFSVHNPIVINQMEDLMLAVTNSMASLATLHSTGAHSTVTADFLTHLVTDYRIGWIGWTPCLSALMRVSEQGYEMSLQMVEKRLLPQLMSDDTTAHFALCELISRDPLALKMIAGLLTNLTEFKRQRFFDCIEHNEKEYVKTYQAEFLPVLQILRQLSDI